MVHKQITQSFVRNKKGNYQAFTACGKRIVIISENPSKLNTKFHYHWKNVTCPKCLRRRKCS